MEILINLENTDRQDTNIKVSWSIDIEPKEYKGIKAITHFLSRKTHIDRTFLLGIENISIPTQLVCDKDRLLYIVYQGQRFESGNLATIEPTSNSIPFQLFLCQKAISDCTEREQKTSKAYTISFDVVLRDDDKAEVQRHHTEVDIRFARLSINPDIRLYIPNRRLQYNSLKREENIGSIIIYNSKTLQYTPYVKVKCRLRLFLGQKELTDVVYMKSSSDNKHLDIGTVSKVKPGKENVVKIPIYINYQQLRNPIEPEVEFSASIQCSYSMEYSPEVIIPKNEVLEKIILLKDLQGTEMKVKVREHNGTGYVEQDVVNGEQKELQQQTFTPCGNMSKQVEVDILNIATDASIPGSGLVIRNLSMVENIVGDVKLVSKDEQYVTSVISMSGDDYEDMAGGSGHFVPNGKDANTRLFLTFNPSKIADVHNATNYDFGIDTTVSFDYWENKDGLSLDKVEKKSFKFTIRWNLHEDPYPEWLCVDYGSSAIVCRYDKQLIDLRKQKTTVFKDFDRALRADEFEKDTKFLSSDIILYRIDSQKYGSISSLCSEQKTKTAYDSLAVCLSPTSSLLIRDARLQLPCLKIMVGNTFLPPNSNYRTFQYNRKNSTTGAVEMVTAKDTINEQSSLLRVASIFKESYITLFRYFVSPVAGDLNRINRLVLTYPNTYSPVHLNIIRGIVNAAFPKLRRNYLKFVSESDAVAAYYMGHYSELNPKGDISSNENVLVYDMGAGTLDISLFHKYRDTATGKIMVDIYGKLGIGKAGNYLDYILADILVWKFGLDKEIASTSVAATGQVMGLRVAMKQFVKDYVKPALSEDRNIVFYYDNATEVKEFKLYDEKSGRNVKTWEISPADIMSDSLFIDYINDCTTGILSQLCKYMGTTKLDIDTVIMSGRSCKLVPLREKLQEAVKSIAPTSKSNMVKFVELNTKTNPNQDKTVVVDGAMQQVKVFDNANSDVIVRSPRLFASYGVIYEQLGGKYKYVELLNHKDIPDKSVKGSFEAKPQIVEKTNAAPSLILVQTYLSAAETEKSWNEHKTDFMTVMEEYDMAELGNPTSLNAHLRIDKDNNIQLYVNGSVSKGNAPKGVDLNTEVTRRSVWPVTF